MFDAIYEAIHHELDSLDEKYAKGASVTKAEQDYRTVCNLPTVLRQTARDESPGFFISFLRGDDHGD